MGRSSVLECIDVVFDRFNSNSTLCCAFCKQFRVVNALRSRSDFLAAHEEIVRVGKAWVVRVKHSVKRSRTNWVAVKHVKVSVKFLSHDLTERLLCLSCQVLELTLSKASFVDKLHTISEIKLEYWISAFELIEWILGVYNGEFSGITGFHVFEHKHHQLPNQIQDFKIMVFEFHFQIQTSEFAQVAISIGVLSAEHRTNLKHALKVAAECHLLVKLWGLSEASVLLEVFQFEYV